MAEPTRANSLYAIRCAAGRRLRGCEIGRESLCATAARALPKMIHDADWRVGKANPGNAAERGCEAAVARSA
jgi:hypothetical protein